MGITMFRMIILLYQNKLDMSIVLLYEDYDPGCPDGIACKCSAQQQQ